MDGHSVSEAVQHVPGAVPAVGAAPAAFPGLVSSAGTPAIATAAAGPAQAAAAGTAPEASGADLAIARELAGAVQRRAVEPAERSLARFTWPWETEAPRHARSGVGEA